MGMTVSGVISSDSHAHSRSGLASLFAWPVLGPVWLCVVAAQGTLMLPLIVGDLAHHLALSTSQAGLFATVAMLGATVAAGFQVVLIRELSWRKMAGATIVVLIAAFAILGTRPVYAISLACVSMLGFGMGGGLSLANAAMARTGQQTRAVGLALGLMGIVGSALASLKSIVGTAQNDMGFYFVLIGVGLTGVIASRSLPNCAPPVQALSPSDDVTHTKAGWQFFAALLAWGAINFASGGFWPLFERIGAASQHTPEAIDHAISLSLLFSTVGGFAAVALGRRVGLIAPLAATGLLTAASVFGITVSSSIAAYTGALCLFGFLWNFGPPYQLPVVSAVDPSGRGMPAAVLSMKIFMAIGPFAYGLIAERFGFSTAGALAALIAALSSVLLVLLVKNLGSRIVQGV